MSKVLEAITIHCWLALLANAALGLWTDVSIPRAGFGGV